jgi:hypothetical protein
VKKQFYRVFPSVVAPIILIGIAIYRAIVSDRWFLCAIPFIVFGNWCAAPNFNLADGFLVIVVVILGSVVHSFCKPLGAAIIFGAATGWFCGSIEKRIRMHPIETDKTDEAA